MSLHRSSSHVASAFEGIPGASARPWHVLGRQPSPPLVRRRPHTFGGGGGINQRGRGESGGAPPHSNGAGGELRYQYGDGGDECE